MLGPMHAYEVRPRKDRRGVDLISDALPFGRQRSVHSRTFRLLLIVAGALLLMAALAPSANAQSLIAYYNFEDGVRGGPPDYTAEPIAFVQTSMVPGGARPYAFPAAREAQG